MTYEEQVWEDVPSTATPITASRLNHMEEGIGTVSSDLDALTSTLSSRIMPQFASLRAALDGAHSCALWGTGDSTLDSSSGTLRMMERWGLRIAAKYPDYRVESFTRDGTADKWNYPSVLQAATGPRYVQTTTRSIRWRGKGTTELLPTTGNLDLRWYGALSDYSPSASGSLLTMCRKDVSGTLSNELVWDFLYKLDGTLSIRTSTDGTSWGTERVSTAAVTGVADGEPIHLRVTREVVSTTVTIKFYTALDSAQTPGTPMVWTQLGTTLSITGTGFYTPVEGAFIEAGGRNWQPASGTSPGKIYRIEIRDGVDGPTLTPVLPELWKRYPDSNTTYGGSPTLTILNAARSGQNLAYHTTANATRLAREAINFGQSVLIFCDSHNEVGKSGYLAWTKPFTDWVEAVQAKLPDTAIVTVRQNPHTSAWANEAAYGQSHKIRLAELDRLCMAKYWGDLDIYGAFLNDSRWDSGVLMNADGLHPSDDYGWDLMTDVLTRAIGRG